MNILQELNNQPYKSYREIPMMKPVSAAFDEHYDKGKNNPLKHDNFKYLIEMKIEKFISPNHDFIKILKNNDRTIIITRERKKKLKQNNSKFDIIATNNSLLSKEKIKFEFLNKMSLIINQDSEISVTEDNEEKLLFLHICENFILINTENSIIIVDYMNNHYSNIFNKTEERQFNIFYNFDELIRVEKKFINRSYIFGHDISGDIFFFVIDDNLFENNGSSPHHLIIRNLKFENIYPDQIMDFKIIKLLNKNEKNWFYLICYMKQKEFIYYISEYSKYSFLSILERINKSDPIIEKFCVSIKKNEFHKQKIYDFHNQTGIGSIIIALGDKMIFLEYKAFITPLEMKHLFSSVRNEINENINKKSKNLNSIALWQNDLQLDDKISRYYTFCLHEYSIDPNDYFLMYQQNKICFISKQSVVITLGKNNEFNKFEVDEIFIDLLNYNEIQRFFVYSKKKFFKLRFTFRFNAIKKIFYNIKEIKSKHAILNNEKISSPIFNLNDNDDQTFETSSVIVKIYLDETKKKKNSNPCMLKGEILCPFCEEFYFCCKAHQSSEWRLFHFFECHILQLFKRILKNGKEGCTRFFYVSFQKSYGKILLEIFKLCKDEMDYQEHLIFINLMIDFLEKIEVFNIFKQMFNKILGMKFKSELKINLELGLEKAILFDTIYYYFSLRLLYTKFCLNSRNKNVAYNTLLTLQDHMKYFRTDNTYKNSNTKTYQIDEKGFEKFKIFLYNELYVKKRNKDDAISHQALKTLEKNPDAYINDKLFNFLVLLRVTIMKYYLKLEIKKDVFIPFIIEISSQFENYQSEKIVLSFFYFNLSFCLIEENKISEAIELLKEKLNNHVIHDKYHELTCAFQHNLGILLYAIGNHLEGIHYLEKAFRLNFNYDLPTKDLLKIQDNLALAYIDKKRFHAAYSLIQQSIGVRSFSFDESYLKQSVKLKYYINFIIEYIDYQFSLFKKNKIWNKDSQELKKFEYEEESLKLIDYICSDFIVDEKEILEFYSEDCIQLTEFLYSLSSSELKSLIIDNLKKNVDKKIQKEFDLPAISFVKEPNKENSSINPYIKDDIEIKKINLNNTSLNPEKLKSLNLNLLKRSIILRDVHGPIDKFNLNFHPIHTRALQKIIENIKSNFFVQVISKETFSGNKIDNNNNIENLFSNNSVLKSLALYLNSRDYNYSVIAEKFKLNAKVEESNNQNIDNSKDNSNSFQNKNKKIEYPKLLLDMVEKLEMQGQADSLNELLWPSYKILNDEEINHLRKNPELFVKFLHYDTNFVDEKHLNKNRENIFGKLSEEIEKTINRRNNLLEGKENSNSNNANTDKKIFYKNLYKQLSQQLIQSRKISIKKIRKSKTFQINQKGFIEASYDEFKEILSDNSIHNISDIKPNNKSKIKHKNTDLKKVKASKMSVYLDKSIIRKSSEVSHNNNKNSEELENSLNLNLSINKNNKILDDFKSEDLNFLSSMMKKIKEKEVESNSTNKLTKGPLNVNMLNPHLKTKLEFSSGGIQNKSKVEYFKKLKENRGNNKSSVDPNSSTKKSLIITNKDNNKQDNLDNFTSSTRNKNDYQQINQSRNYKSAIKTSEFNINQSLSTKKKNEISKNEASSNVSKMSPLKLTSPSKLDNNKDASYQKKIKEFDSSPIGNLGKYMTSSKANSIVNKNEKKNNINKSVIMSRNDDNKLKSEIQSSNKPNNDIKKDITNNHTRNNESTQGIIGSTVSMSHVETLTKPINNKIKPEIKDNCKTQSKSTINKNLQTKRTSDLTANEAISNPIVKKYISGGGVQYQDKKNTNQPKKNMIQNESNLSEIINKLK